MTHNFTVGMEVFIDDNCYGSNRPMRLCVVEKVTATQFTAGGLRFKGNGDYGVSFGSRSWNNATCHIATDKSKAKNQKTIERRTAESKLQRISDVLHKLRDDEAVATLDILPQAIKDMVKP